MIKCPRDCRSAERGAARRVLVFHWPFSVAGERSVYSGPGLHDPASSEGSRRPRDEVRLPQGATVADLLRVLANRADVDPPDALFSHSSGCLKTEILVMVNGRQLSFLQGTDTILSADDEVLLLPAGGRRLGATSTAAMTAASKYIEVGTGFSAARDGFTAGREAAGNALAGVRRHDPSLTHSSLLPVPTIPSGSPLGGLHRRFLPFHRQFSVPARRLLRGSAGCVLRRLRAGRSWHPDWEIADHHAVFRASRPRWSAHRDRR